MWARYQICELSSQHGSVVEFSAGDTGQMATLEAVGPPMVGAPAPSPTKPAAFDMVMFQPHVSGHRPTAPGRIIPHHHSYQPGVPIPMSGRYQGH